MNSNNETENPIMKSPIMKYFAYSHLPQEPVDLQTPSRLVSELAEYFERNVEPCAEKTAGLRKLLEAKDCFVRASLAP